MRGSEPAARIGLVAGCGLLPREAARTLRAAGAAVCALAFEGLTDPALADEVDRLEWHRLGQLQAAAALLRSMDVGELLIVGALPKRALFDAPARVAPDATAAALLARAGGRADEALFGALAGWLVGEGFRIARQDLSLAPLVAGAELASDRAPSAAERLDVEVGRGALAACGGAGIGQCVVVRQGCVVAVEAIEGTDEAIRRAGRLAGPGASVVKGARRGQDPRFDLPTVGPGTIAAMIEAGATCLAVEADSTLVVARAETRRAADRAGIAWTAFAPDRAGP